MQRKVSQEQIGEETYRVILNDPRDIAILYIYLTTPLSLLGIGIEEAKRTHATMRKNQEGILIGCPNLSPIKAEVSTRNDPQKRGPREETGGGGFQKEKKRKKRENLVSSANLGKEKKEKEKEKSHTVKQRHLIPVEKRGKKAIRYKQSARPKVEMKSHA